MHAVFRLPRPAVITGPGDYVAVLQHEDEDAEDAGCGAQSSLPLSGLASSSFHDLPRDGLRLLAKASTGPSA
ncbi:MAG: hypothetical protein ACO3ZY_13270, partial [Phycisphaerales bacterium]